MNMKTIDLLNGLKEKLDETGIYGDSNLFTAKEVNAPTDILRFEIPAFGTDVVSVLGEFFFIPIEDDELLYFSSIVTLTNNLPVGMGSDAAQAIARLNYYVPCGSFSLGDNDKNLVFRHTVTLPVSRKKEELLNDMFTAADIAIGTAHSYEGYLKLVIKNEITVGEMLDMLLHKDIKESGE